MSKALSRKEVVWSGAPAEKAGRRPRVPFSLWLPAIPFLFFALAFVVMPLLAIALQSFQGAQGLLGNYAALTSPQYLEAFRHSFSLSLATALLGVLIGAPAALALHRLPSRRLKAFLTTLSAVAANFAGVPLAFAYIVLLGNAGVLTHLLQLGDTFSLYSWWGLLLIYLYFQIPLFIILFLPSVAALKPAWLEAAATLGARPFFFWRQVGLPILLPSALGAGALLFANSFGAYATAFALMGARYNLLPIQVSLAAAGNVGYAPGEASATAVVMVALLLVATLAYLKAQRRARLWWG
ncbi:MAG: hypothetical protein QJR00_07700 [Bacillota bacterium]|nr:hypothetical protein [Bacillota bacterium]